MDVVYILKNTKHNEELRYSLRSLKNIKGVGKVVFAGGHPVDFRCDYHIPVLQDSTNKYNNTKKIVETICHDDRLSDEILLMNDDFFVMKEIKLKDYKNIFNCTLAEQIVAIERNNKNTISRYTNKLRNAYILLGVLGIADPLNFETHTPFKINRKYGKAVTDLHFNIPFRTLYESIMRDPKQKHEDNKIATLDGIPKGDEIILSTTDESFRNGAIGKYIREMFKRKSKYEI